MALLPNVISLQVEHQICNHRKQRKLLFERRPNGWPGKLEKVNKKEMAFVYNRKTFGLANSTFMKTRTTVMDGKLQIIGSCKHYEVIRVHFELDHAADSNEGFGGTGKYFLTSLNFETRQLCCVKCPSTSSMSGWDLFKENYTGVLVLGAVSGISREKQRLYIYIGLLIHWKNQYDVLINHDKGVVNVMLAEI